jgi:recombination endonuclease VII
VSQWTCRKCGSQWTRRKQRCTCGRARPKKRGPAHRRALDYPYEWYVEQFGERCGICGWEPTPFNERRLDRDHDHDTGEPRGLLCWLCNKRLDKRADVDWLLNAANYLDGDAIDSL